MSHRLGFVVSAVGSILASASLAQSRADLAMQFVYDGKAPAPKPFELSKDQEYCGKFRVIDESLVVDGATGGIANVVVFLLLARNEAAPDAPPDDADATATVRIDPIGCRFEPRVTLLRTSQTLVIGNKDPIAHRVQLDFFNRQAFPFVPAAAALPPLHIERAERLPVRMSCAIHPWMNGWIVVKDHPYMGVSDKAGKLVIRNLPVGPWSFQVWHERGGYLKSVNVNSKPVTWPKGRMDVTMAAKAPPLIVTVPPAAFERH